MVSRTVVWSGVTLVLFVFGMPLASSGPLPSPWTALPWEAIQCPEHPEALEDQDGIFHEFPEPTNPLLTVAVHVLCLGDVLEPFDTDCASTKYKLNNYEWQASMGFTVDSSGSGITGTNTISTSAETWDAETATELHGGTGSGGNGQNAGTLDDVNQVGWKNLASGTIAVTTTWYFTQTGQAVESDAAYNTDFAWSTSGEAGKMDLQNIATHEIGHTFGLGHPKGPAGQIGCLTMYAYGAEGETKKRTLGDGDIIGIETIYGA